MLDLDIASTSVTAMQGPGNVTARAAWGMLTALVPALLMNVCIVGINQIFDVAIDKARPPGLEGRRALARALEALPHCCISQQAVGVLLWQAV